MASDKKETPLIDEFDAKNISGLSEQKAADRLRKEGYNELSSTKQRSVFAIDLEVVRDGELRVPRGSNSFRIFLSLVGLPAPPRLCVVRLRASLQRLKTTS